MSRQLVGLASTMRDQWPDIEMMLVDSIGSGVVLARKSHWPSGAAIQARCSGDLLALAEPGQGVEIGYLGGARQLPFVRSLRGQGHRLAPETPLDHILLGLWMQSVANPRRQTSAGTVTHLFSWWSGPEVPAPAQTLRTNWLQVADLCLHGGVIYGVTRDGNNLTFWELDLEGVMQEQFVRDVGASPIRTYLDAELGVCTALTTGTQPLYSWGFINGSHQLVDSNPLTGLFRPGMSFAGRWAIVPSGQNFPAITESPGYLQWAPPGPTSPFIDATLAAFAGGDLWTQIADGDPGGSNPKCTLLRRNDLGQWQIHRQVNRWAGIPANYVIRSIGLPVPLLQIEGEEPRWALAISHHERLEKAIENFPAVYGRYGPSFGLNFFTDEPKTMPSDHSFRYSFGRTLKLTFAGLHLSTGDFNSRLTLEVAAEPVDAPSVALVEAAISLAYPNTGPPSITNVWGGVLAEGELPALQITGPLTGRSYGQWPDHHFFPGGGWCSLPRGESNTEADPAWPSSVQSGGGQTGGPSGSQIYWDGLKPRCMLTPRERVMTSDVSDVRTWKLITEPETWYKNVIVRAGEIGEYVLVEANETLTIRQNHPDAGVMEFSTIVPYEVHSAAQAINDSAEAENRYVRVRDTLQHSAKSAPEHVADWRPPKQLVEVRDGQTLALLATLDLQDHTLLTADCINQSGTVFARAGQDFQWLHSVPQIRLNSYGGRLYLVVEFVASKVESYRVFPGSTQQVIERRDYSYVYDITDSSDIYLINGTGESYAETDSFALSESRARSDIPDVGRTAWSQDWIYYPLRRLSDTELRRQRGSI